jgi:hypothetical protein
VRSDVSSTLRFKKPEYEGKRIIWLDASIGLHAKSGKVRQTGAAQMPRAYAHSSSIRYALWWNAACAISIPVRRHLAYCKGFNKAYSAPSLGLSVTSEEPERPGGWC